jgi:hypothetical protein
MKLERDSDSDQKNILGDLKEELFLLKVRRCLFKSMCWYVPKQALTGAARPAGGEQAT